MMRVHGILMYAESERQDAILNYGMSVAVNGTRSREFSCDESITLLGEYMSGDLKQFIFSNGESVFTIYEGHVTIAPKEKLEVGDFVFIDWGGAMDKKNYQVVRINNTYRLDGIQEGLAFTDSSSLEELLRRMKMSCVVTSYKILPKNEYHVYKGVAKNK
jgi:hypothetical protein